MQFCKLFWNQKAPDDTRWVTLLGLCCQCTWQTSTVLFLQGLHMRKYTTPRLDVGMCPISLQVTPQDCSESMVSTQLGSVLRKVALQQLLSHCRCCNHWFPWRIPRSAGFWTSFTIAGMDHSAGQPRSLGLRLLLCRLPYNFLCAGFLVHLVHPCCRRRHRRRPHHPLVLALVLEELHQLSHHFWWVSMARRLIMWTQLIVTAEWPPASWLFRSLS